MTTFPDPSETPEYPATLDGIRTVQNTAKDNVRIPPFTEEEIAGAGEYNFWARNIVAIVNDIRAFISVFGLSPDTPDFKKLVDAAAVINVGLGGGGGGLALDFEKQVSSGSPAFETTIAIFPLFVLSGLEMSLGTNFTIKASSITAESSFTVVDPNSIFSIGPTFSTGLANNRVVKFTTDAGALDGQTATIAWLWNNVPFKVTVTVVLG